jgi:hypothetical protein
MTTIPVYVAMGRIDEHIFVDPNGDKWIFGLYKI